MLVSRQRHSRLGYFLLQVFECDDPKVRLLVNRGWVPQDLGVTYKATLEGDLKDHKVVALLKKGEQVEVKKKQLEFFRSAPEPLLIDLETFSRQLTAPVLSGAYLEEFISDKTISQTLYPVKASRDTYQMPYLTPQKHLEYATFWGCSALLGMWGFAKALRRR